MTYPTTRASALELFQLRRADILRLLIFPHAVDDVVAIQALEEAVAAIPALRAGAAIGCYEASVLRGSGWRRRRLRVGGAEPTHDGVLCMCVVKGVKS